MTLVFACESRFIKWEDNYYSDSQSFGDVLWERYLMSFDSIVVFARIKLVTEFIESNEYFQITNPKVSFVDVPYYIGPKEYLKKRKNILEIAKENAIESRAYICRVPGMMGAVLSSALRSKNIPYAVEVVGDPWDVFAPEVIKHPFSPIFRILGRITLRKIVRGSKAALYVTKHQLQKRYPVNIDCYTTYASDVILKETHIAPPKEWNRSKNEIKLLSVGSLAQMYKSPDVAIETVSILNKRGINCTFCWLGDGVYRSEMENLAKQLGVSKKIIFMGNVSLEKVREELSKSNIFLHISRTEGLPRAVVEAMGAGLPCIGSRVGGIPELLDDIALVEKIEPEVVANKIEEFINSTSLMQNQAQRNYEQAQDYLEGILTQRRESFYAEIIRLSNL